MDDEYLTVQEAARKLGVSVPTVYGILTKDATLPEQERRIKGAWKDTNAYPGEWYIPSQAVLKPPRRKAG